MLLRDFIWDSISALDLSKRFENWICFCFTYSSCFSLFCSDNVIFWRSDVLRPKEAMLGLNMIDSGYNYEYLFQSLGFLCKSDLKNWLVLFFEEAMISTTPFPAKKERGQAIDEGWKRREKTSARKGSKSFDSEVAENYSALKERGPTPHIPTFR